MGKKSGADNVLLWAKELGIEISDDEVVEVVQRVKSRALDQRCSLCKEEFQKILDEIRK
jgi:isopropylmalate/homocitrate/citramalate synthase